MRTRKPNYINLKDFIELARPSLQKSASHASRLVQNKQTGEKGFLKKINPGQKKHAIIESDSAPLAEHYDSSVNLMKIAEQLSESFEKLSSKQCIYSEDPAQEILLQEKLKFLNKDIKAFVQYAHILATQDGNLKFRRTGNLL